jgi:hypothetical protein
VCDIEHAMFNVFTGIMQRSTMISNVIFEYHTLLINRILGNLILPYFLSIFVNKIDFNIILVLITWVFEVSLHTDLNKTHKYK